MVHKFQRAWKNNVAAAFIIGIALTLAIGLQLAEAVTGPLQIYERFGEYGGRNFATGSTGYPRIVNDSGGYALKLTRPTRTVASQYWSLDEYLYSIVPPETVVSVSQSAYDRSFSNVFQQVEMFRPAITMDPEIILKLDPDLLLISSDARADFTQLLRVAGVPIFRAFTSFTKLDDVRRTIRLIGYLTGRDTEAAQTDREFGAAIEKARLRKPPGTPAPRILGYSAGYSYGDQTLFDDVIRTLGGVNVGAEQGLHTYDAVSTEQILRWNPEWIISSSARGQSQTVLRRLLEDPAISLTVAARKGQIVVLENNVFLPMSPYTILTLEALGEALYR